MSFWYSARNALSAVIATLALSGCAAPTRSPPPTITQAEWSKVRQRLAWMRSTESETPYSIVLRVGMSEPWTGQHFEARGALAVQPHSAMRMILLGPAGGTALDVWVTREKWRFVVPAAHIKRTGGVDVADARGFPVGFFRWWFLSPLEGRLLTARVDPSGPTFVIREGVSTVTMHESRERGREHLLALRREGDEVEGIEWIGRTVRPEPGDHARYVQETSGLAIDVLVEAVSHEQPDPAAFLDPDDPGVPL